MILRTLIAVLLIIEELVLNIGQLKGFMTVLLDRLTIVFVELEHPRSLDVVPVLLNPHTLPAVIAHFAEDLGEVSEYPRSEPRRERHDYRKYRVADNHCRGIYVVDKCIHSCTTFTRG